MDPVGFLIVVIASLFIPPLGVLFISGCSVDLLINVGLTMLGYLPGLLHAFYLEYIYYSRREDAANGITGGRAPGVYSDTIQSGGYSLRQPRFRESAPAAGPRPAQYRDNPVAPANRPAPPQPQKQTPPPKYEEARADAARQEPGSQ
ncbi:hypothetical protein V1525DRAFT_358925 [Lipomyces kononenkoae]|uniref:Uncharacterized protein n=1 Tax=Lipomyces kononenkoae TaxID=34357 RepID=A0ACC3T2M4_LIPKO